MDGQEFTDQLADIETKLDRLKALYEQWFQGLERLEPTIPRKEVDRRIFILRREQPRNTALRYRFQQVVQRYTTLTTYWTRVARQIEEGTFRRDVMRARKRRDEFRAEVKQRGLKDKEVELSTAELESIDESEWMPSTAPKAPPPPPPPRLSRTQNSYAPDRMTASDILKLALANTQSKASQFQKAVLPSGIEGSTKTDAPNDPEAGMRAAYTGAFPKPAALPRVTNIPSQFDAPTRAAIPRPRNQTPFAEGLPDDAVKRVYEQFVAARKKNNESTESVSLQSMSRKINDMLPSLKEKYGTNQVDFEVVMKDGRVGLKPVPKK